MSMRTLATAALCATLVVAAPSGLVGQQIQVVRDSVFFNFQDLEVRAALNSISEVLGLNYLVSGDVSGKTVTMRTRRAIPVEQVPDVLEAILQTQGLRLEQRGDLFIVSAVPQGEAAAQEALPEQEIFVYFLENADAVEVANLLVTLFGGETGRFQRQRRIQQEATLSEQLRRFQLPAGAVGVVEQPAPRERVQPQEPQRGAVTAELVGGLTVVPDERTNALVVRTAAENWPSIERTIELLDIRPLQVLIEVLIAEVTLDDQTQFGVNFSSFFGGDPEATVSNFNPANLPPDSVGFTGTVFDPDFVNAVFRALATDDKLNVLSTPRVLASNNQEARILIGSEVPFEQISTFGGVANQVIRSVQFRDVGLELAVVPRINQERQVTLEIRQQNSSVSSATFGDLAAPVITTREAETSLVVGDGRTVVLGGLIETQRQRSESGIPILKDIPILGFFFGSTSIRNMKRELIITLTPYIVGSDEEAERLRERLEREREWLEEIKEESEFEPARPPGAGPDTVPTPRDTLRGLEPDTVRLEVPDVVPADTAARDR